MTGILTNGYYATVSAFKDGQKWLQTTMNLSLQEKFVNNHSYTTLFLLFHQRIIKA